MIGVGTVLMNTTLNCTAGPNIIGGNCTGGNFWGGYDGWDVDLDGTGDTILPFNGTSNSTYGDELPLTEVGKISCGGTARNVTQDVSLNRNIVANLSSDEVCFTG